MDHELDLLLGSAIDTLVKLEVLLYLRGRPGAVQSPADISAVLRRSEAEVRSALEDLARCGLVDRFSLGTGRHVMYGSAEDAHVQTIVDLLHARYERDADHRARLVRQITTRKESEE